MLWTIGFVLVWLGAYLGFQLVDRSTDRKWSTWLETHSAEITKCFIVWTVRFRAPQLKKWCRARRQVVRALFQLGSILGVMTCCLIAIGLVWNGVLAYLIFASCVITRRLFWRMDPVELANEFPMVSSLRRLLTKISNALMLHWLEWFKSLHSEIPFSLLWLLCFVGLLVILPLHELGHALIALAEGVEVKKVGLFLGFFIPGMFIVLEEDVEDLNATCRLRIFCGGFWFNCLLCLVSLCLLCCIPIFAAPFFKHGVAVSGLMASEQASKSNLSSLLSVGDELVNINNQEIRQVKDIKKAVWHLVSETHFGMCLNQDNFSNSEYFRPFHACCPGLASDNEESEYKCFVQSSFFNTGYPNAVCISDRWLETQDFAIGACDENSHDMYFIPYTGTGARLVALKRWIAKEQRYSQSLVVLHPERLFAVKWTEYVPRITSPWWLYQVLVMWNPIGKIEQLLRFLVILSGVVGISNMAPVWRMDGEDVFSWILVFFSSEVTNAEYMLRKKRLLGWFTALFILSFPLLFILMDLN